MADDDEANALLDARLLAYLNAYQEYTVLTVELQSVLREGHIKLAHARRELSRTTSTSALSFGTTCVPRLPPHCSRPSAAQAPPRMASSTLSHSLSSPRCCARCCWATLDACGPTP